MLQHTIAKTTILLFQVAIMNPSVAVVMASKYYVIQYPKTDRNIFHGRCHGGANCSQGWYKANLPNTWGLCKIKEDAKNKR